MKTKNQVFEFLNGGVEAVSGHSIYELVSNRPNTRSATAALNSVVQALLEDPRTREIGVRIDSEVGNLLCVCVEDSVEVLAEFLDGLLLKVRSAG